jgi:hypothetical protein
MTEGGIESLQYLETQPGQKSECVDWIFPNNDQKVNAVSKTVYSTLPDISWFRLLVLLPNNDIWAPIQCQLKPYKRGDVGGQYEALSYAWREGDPIYQAQIIREKGQSKPSRLCKHVSKLSVSLISKRKQVATSVDHLQ